MEERGTNGWTSLSMACAFVNGDGEGSVQEMFDEASQASPPVPLLQADYPLKATSAVHLGSSCEQYAALQAAVLRNQDTLRVILRNQDMLKDLVDRLLETLSSFEERFQALEREMGVISQFTQELSRVENETNWG